MRLRSLRLVGWRNLAPTRVEPGPRVTVFFGENGQGKTNLLEATYYLGELRSFRTKAAEEIVQWGSERAEATAQVEALGLERRLDVEIAAGRKRTRVDGKVVRRDAEGLRGIGVVLFVPEDLMLPKAPPASRRSFLDRAAFGLDRLFWAEAVAFQRVLKSRNAILRGQSVRPALLDTYDEELARAGARLVARRRSVVDRLGPRVARLYHEIHDEGLEVAIRYRSAPAIEACATEAEVREALLAGIARQREIDLRRRFTGFGPQTDDLEIALQARLAREHGSQGQLRSLVLALKLAELDSLAEALGEPPLLLLDDVASELDETRRRKLFEAVAGLCGQTFVTMTDRTLLPLLPGRVDFEVARGTVRPA